MLSPSQPGIPTFSFNSFSMFLSRASAVWLETLGPQWRLHNLLMGLSLGNLGQHHWKYQCTKMQLATIGYNWLDCPCYSHSCSCSSPGKNLVTFDSLSCCFFWATSLVSHTHTLTFCWNHRSCPIANCHHTTFPWFMRGILPTILGQTSNLFIPDRSWQHWDPHPQESPHPVEEVRLVKGCEHL